MQLKSIRVELFDLELKVTSTTSKAKQEASHEGVLYCFGRLCGLASPRWHVQHVTGVEEPKLSRLMARTILNIFLAASFAGLSSFSN